MENKEEFYLSYKNADLNSVDYNGFQPCCWLTSGSIQFQYEHLRQTYELPNYFLMDPTQTQLILDPFTDFSDLQEWFSQQFFQAEYIFIPVNDTESFDIPGAGSHWALLVFEKKTNKFLYFDSAGGFVSKAGKIAQMMNAIIKKDKKLLKTDKIPIQVNNNTPKQENSYDCGMFVLVLTEVLCHLTQKISMSQSLQNQPLISTLASQKIVSKKREQILDWVHKLYKEKQQKQQNPQVQQQQQLQELDTEQQQQVKE